MIKAQPHGERRLPARKRARVTSLPDVERSKPEVVLYEAPGVRSNWTLGWTATRFG